MPSKALEGHRILASGDVLYTRYNHVFPPNKPSCLLGGSNDFNSTVIVTATSVHPGGVNVAMADGSARYASSQVDARVWSALGSIAGGEIVGAGQF